MPPNRRLRQRWSALATRSPWAGKAASLWVARPRQGCGQGLRIDTAHQALHSPYAIMFRVSTVAFTARLRIAADESLLESYVVAAAPYGGNGSGNDGEFGGWKGRHGETGSLSVFC
jgi:hypothetical protein